VASTIPILVFASLVIGIVGGILGLPLNILWNLLVLALVGLLLFSPIAVHFDRKYVADVSEWTPSVWNYLTFLALPGMVIAGLYLLKRRKHVGAP